MYAIVKISGRQYRVSRDEVIRVDRLKAEPGEELIVSDVMMISDGEQREIGSPHVPYRVCLEVIEHGRDRKQITRRFVRRGGMRRKRGYRRSYSMVKIKSIEQGE